MWNDHVKQDTAGDNLIIQLNLEEHVHCNTMQYDPAAEVWTVQGH